MEFGLTKIDRLRYRPSKEADDFLNDLRVALIPGEKARVARLAIARSLFESEPVSSLDDDVPKGAAIEGTHLFGEDGDLWAALIAAAAVDRLDTQAAFRGLVEAHWDRGAKLLKQDFHEADKDEVRFAIRLASLAPAPRTTSTGTSGGLVAKGGRIEVQIGSVSEDWKTGAPVTTAINAPGQSPHIALMGKTRSGKSRTGLEIAQSIIGQTDGPLLLIDPKGEFVKDGSLVKKPEWGGRTLDSIFPGITPIDVSSSPVPLDFLWTPANSPESTKARIAIGFRDSFQNCIRAKGDVALDSLREAVLNLLMANRGRISLGDILGELQEVNESRERRPGGIEAKLSELVSLGSFEPKLNPEEFFSRRWVVSLGGATAESKRLTMFLLLDALRNYLLSLSDSGVDGEGNRAVRHLLIIDEAREILSYRHAALSELLRKGAAKGSMTMLLSQSPDDFEQEEDDFLEQIGTIVVFASGTQSVRKLSAGMGRRMRPEDFADSTLPRGVAFTKLPGETPRKVIAWKQ